jgi:hypothetical protein
MAPTESSAPLTIRVNPVSGFGLGTELGGGGVERGAGLAEQPAIATASASASKRYPGRTVRDYWGCETAVKTFPSTLWFRTKTDTPITSVIMTPR